VSELRVGVNNLPLLGKSQGVRRYVTELTRALQGRPDLQISSVGLSTDKQHPFLTIPKIGFPLRQARELFIGPFLAAPKISVFHYPDTYGPIISRGRPTVITVHDTTFLTHTATHDAWVSNWLSYMTRYSWPRATRIIAVSDVTATDLLDNGVPADKITVIPHGVDHILRQELSSIDETKGRRYIAYMGNIEPRKDVPTLLRAFTKILDEIPNDIDLILAGKVAWGPALPETLLAHGRIRTLGYLPESRLAGFLRNASVFVYPSVYEGFGLPPLEALRLGTRVVAGDTPVARETLADQADFFLPGDSDELGRVLVRILRGSDTSASARVAHAKQYTWAKAAEATARVYQSALA
jgi:glycosyltransferase involved in cell wall biosynthesis